MIPIHTEIEDIPCASVNREPSQNRANHSDLIAPQQNWDRFRAALLATRPGTDEEVLGLLFCTRHISGPVDRYLAKHWYVPSPDQYAYQATGGLSLTQEAHAQVLARYLSQGLHPVHVHTHPGTGQPSFSGIDDANETAYAGALRHLPWKPRLLSGVFDRDVRAGTVRIWPASQGETPKPVRLAHSWVPEAAEWSCATHDEMFDRQRIFGAAAQRRLGELSIALIGCGGIGAPFAEQASRLGVRSWILVDDDRLSMTNVHRMPSTTRAMAERGVPKVDYVKGIIQRFWERSARVHAFQRPIEDERVQQRVATADLVVVATDNHHSRLIAQQLALRYLRPLLCLGTHIEKRQSEETPRIYARITMPPVHGGWCLPCAGIISLDEASREVADSQTRAMLSERGYLDGVPAPAVFHVNSLCAARATGLLHGIVAGFIHEQPVDWIVDQVTGQQIQIEHDESPSCFFCSDAGLLASGDTEPSRWP